MNNSVVAWSERTGKYARGFATPASVVFERCAPGCRVRLVLANLDSKEVHS